MSNHLQIDQESLEKIEKNLKNTWLESTRKRLKVILMASQKEYATKEIAETIGVSNPTVLKYLNLFRASGVEGLLKTEYPTSAVYRRLDEETSTLLREKVKHNEFKDLDEVQAWLATRSVEIPRHLLYQCLLRIGWAKKNNMQNFDQEGLKEVEEALKTVQNVRKRKRLQVVLMASQAMASQGNISTAEIARAVGVSRPSIPKYIKRFQTGGLNSLMESGHSILTAKSCLGLETHNIFREKILNGDFDRASDVQQWLTDHSIHMSRALLYYYLHKFGWKPKSKLQVNPSNIKEIEEALSNTQDERSRKRLQIVLMACQSNPTAKEISKALGISMSSVFMHVQHFRDGGITALLETAHSKNTIRNSFNSEIVALLREKIERNEFASVKAAQAWLAARSINVPLEHTYYYLRKLGWKRVGPLKRKTVKATDQTNAACQIPDTAPDAQPHDKSEPPPPQQQQAAAQGQDTPAPTSLPSQGDV